MNLSNQSVDVCWYVVVSECVYVGPSISKHRAHNIISLMFFSILIIISSRIIIQYTIAAVGLSLACNIVVDACDTRCEPSTLLNCISVNKRVISITIIIKMY